MKKIIIAVGSLIALIVFCTPMLFLLGLIYLFASEPYYDYGKKIEIYIHESQQNNIDDIIFIGKYPIYNDKSYIIMYNEKNQKNYIFITYDDDDNLNANFTSRDDFENLVKYQTLIIEEPTKLPITLENIAWWTFMLCMFPGSIIFSFYGFIFMIGKGTLIIWLIKTVANIFMVQVDDE